MGNIQALSADIYIKEAMENLITKERIKHRIKELGCQITNDYRGTTPVSIGILKGVLCFLPDLLKSIDLTIELDFAVISFHQNILILEKDIGIDIENRKVIIVDDILDTGDTLNLLVNHIKQKTKDISICVLLVRERVRNIEPNYIGFTVPDKFILGYGLEIGSEGI